jgi:hypothetical protein
LYETATYRAPGLGLRKLKEGSSEALPVMGWCNSDVINVKFFGVNGEDDHLHDSFMALGEGSSLVGDDLCVIVGHRARPYPETLDVVPLRGVNEHAHCRNICPGAARRP